MNEVVLIPTFDRPELLFLTLERIRQVEPSINIHVFADRCQYGEESLLIGQFGAVLHATKAHKTFGNTENVMEAFKWAYKQDYDRIYLIEDDVLCHFNFFTYHREAMETFNVSCGWKFMPDWPDAKDYHPIQQLPFYFSIGVCLSRAFLYHVTQHATLPYYLGQKLYVENHFKKSKRAKGNYEQDGLITRIMELNHLQAAWPSAPVCTHIGEWFHGYNRTWNKKLVGTLEQRIEKARAIVESHTVTHWPEYCNG